MGDIYLIRHGQATFERDNYDHLSEKGFEQAKLVSNHLEKTGIKFDSFYYGENLRHKQTMEPSLKLLNDKSHVFIKPSFTEYEFGIMMREVIPYIIKNEPTFKSDVDRMFDNNRSFQQVFEKTVYTWLSNQDIFKAAPWKIFVGKMREALEEVVSESGSGKKIAVFSSGGAISAAVQSVLNISERDALKLSFQILNASITRLKYNSDIISLCSINEAGFLAEKNMITFR